jgi:hypothetical protein
VEPPLRLTHVTYEHGEMDYPRHADRADESALARHLEDGRRVLADARPPTLTPCADDVSTEFEHLRWFDLPHESLVDG